MGVNEGLRCIKRTLNQWSFISRSSCYLYGLIIGVILVVHFTSGSTLPNSPLSHVRCFIIRFTSGQVMGIHLNYKIIVGL